MSAESVSDQHMTVEQAFERYFELKARKKSIAEDQRIAEHLKTAFGATTRIRDITASRIAAYKYRPEYSHAWGGKTYYRQLRIDPLPPESAADLLEALLGTDAALGPLKQLLVERTEGNPLFLEESVRALVETEELSSLIG